MSAWRLFEPQRPLTDTRGGREYAISCRLDGTRQLTLRDPDGHVVRTGQGHRTVDGIARLRTEL